VNADTSVKMATPGCEPPDAGTATSQPRLFVFVATWPGRASGAAAGGHHPFRITGASCRDVLLVGVSDQDGTASAR